MGFYINLHSMTCSRFLIVDFSKNALIKVYAITYLSWLATLDTSVDRREQMFLYKFDVISIKRVAFHKK